jgi:Tfp pilus assembly protein PilF
MLSCLLAAALMAGCATNGPRPPFTSPPSPEGVFEQENARSTIPAYIRRVREASRGGGSRANGALVAETWSQDLASAISRHTEASTPESEIRLAEAYVRVGILDTAREHFESALRLDPKEAAAWDGLARIWRDWGFPQLALGDAYRAVWAAPRSAAVHNTLGTILLNLGKGPDARVHFTQAAELDPAAAYAHNNLCYSWLMEGETEVAATGCNRALAIDSGLSAARNNLALAKATAGDVAGAARIFERAGGEAAAQYNVGIIHLAQRRCAAAADAFDRAAVLQPSLVLAQDRARQARQCLTEALESEMSHDRR